VTAPSDSRTRTGDGSVEHLRGLVALTELVVEHGSDEGGALTLRVEWIAEKFTELQSHRCFHRGESLGTLDEVDHFVPWSKYPRDPAHNFVLAHATRNRSQSDMLADIAHAEPSSSAR
jgi:CRISPR/Cas system Type II protein with McrA/HNH and RuvC-like nuclease domain